MRPALLFGAARERGHAFAERWRGARPPFVCILAHTDTCLIPGVSSAGISEELRPLTPAADAEVVQLGRPVCLPELPSNPLGAPGPAGITRAALCLGGLRATFLGAGLQVWPATACVQVCATPGGDVRLGRAVPNAGELFELGLALGREQASSAAHLVIGESVPGGTTPALALPLAPGNAHALKARVTSTALAAAGLRPGDGRAAPLAAVAAIGDPMQPLVAGMALGAAAGGGEVLLAGGSQMLAVAALIR